MKKDMMVSWQIPLFWPTECWTAIRIRSSSSFPPLFLFLTIIIYHLLQFMSFLCASTLSFIVVSQKATTFFLFRCPSISSISTPFHRLFVQSTVIVHHQSPSPLVTPHNCQGTRSPQSPPPHFPIRISPKRTNMKKSNWLNRTDFFWWEEFDRIPELSNCFHFLLCFFSPPITALLPENGAASH